jgi:ABC-type iron transport system FetAB permease component
MIFGLKIHRSLLVAAIRMAVQLALVGLMLFTLHPGGDGQTAFAAGV